MNNLYFDNWIIPHDKYIYFKQHFNATLNKQYSFDELWETCSSLMPESTDPAKLNPIDMFFRPLNAPPIISPETRDTLLNAVKLDIFMNLLNVSSYFACRKSMSLRSLSEQAILFTRGPLIEYTDKACNDLNRNFNLFFHAHTAPLHPAIQKDDKRRKPTSKFILLHGVPAILTYYNCIYENGLASPSTQPANFSYDAFRDLHDKSRKILEALYRHPCIKEVPFDLAAHQLDYFWSTDYVSELIASYFSNAETILVRMALPSMWDVLDGTESEISVHRTKTDHEINVTKSKQISSVIRRSTADNINKQILKPEFEKDWKTLEYLLDKFQKELPCYPQTKRKLFEIYLSSPQAIIQQPDKLVMFIQNAASVFTDLLNYLFIPENASITYIDFYVKVYELCKNSQSYLLRKYKEQRGTMEIPQQNKLTTLLNITDKDIYNLISHAIYGPYHPSARLLDEAQAINGTEVAGNFQILFSGIKDSAYTRNNDEIIYLQCKAE